MTLLEQIGIYLFGEFWQTQLATSLKVSRRSVCRWFAGTHPIPAGVWDDLKHLMEDKRELDAKRYKEIISHLTNPEDEV